VSPSAPRNTTASAPSTFTESYESLRAYALGDASPPDACLAMTLLLRRGVAGWLDAVATVKMGAVERGVATPLRTFDVSPRADDAELAQLLVSMALGAYGRAIDAAA
jgi:hypothetical protein